MRQEHEIVLRDMGATDEIIRFVDTMFVPRVMVFNPSAQDTLDQEKILKIKAICSDDAGLSYDIQAGLFEMDIVTRKREIVVCRQQAMTFSKLYTKANLAKIGNFCGGKDHATVLNSIRVINNLIETDKVFRERHFKTRTKVVIALSKINTRWNLSAMEKDVKRKEVMSVKVAR